MFKNLLLLVHCVLIHKTVLFYKTQNSLNQRYLIHLWYCYELVPSLMIYKSSSHLWNKFNFVQCLTILCRATKYGITSNYHKILKSVYRDDGSYRNPIIAAVTSGSSTIKLSIKHVLNTQNKRTLCRSLSKCQIFNTFTKPKKAFPLILFYKLKISDHVLLLNILWNMTLETACHKKLTSNLSQSE